MQTLMAVFVGSVLILVPALQALTLAYFHMKQTELMVRTADLTARADQQAKTTNANKLEAIAARTAFEDRVVNTITNGTMAALKDTALQAASSATAAVPPTITVPPAQVIVVTSQPTGTPTAGPTTTEAPALANLPTKNMGMINSNPSKGATNG